MRHSPKPYESLRSDSELFQKIIESVSSKKKLSVDAYIERANELAPAGKKELFSRKELAGYMEGLPIEAPGFAGHDQVLEAIVLFEGRPSLLIQNGTYAKPSVSDWQERLDPYRPVIDKAIGKVGRLELIHHTDYAWAGTAWVIDHRVLVTNRHVASIFARKQGSEYIFVSNPFGVQVGARVDFREEYAGLQPLEISVEKVLYIAENRPNAADIALLLLDNHGDIPEPLDLAEQDANPHDPIAVIGYPARDTRNDGMIMGQIFGDIFDVKRLAPGKVSHTSPAAKIFEHDCSTLGGNSGSPVINYESGKAVGLHFSGRFGVANFAVKVSELKKVLSNSLPASVIAGGADTERRVASDYDSREGYQENFLGSSTDLHVALPELTAAQKADAVEVRPRGRGLSKYVLDYTHFSIVMCKSRRTAYFTAVNIDGSEEVIIRRRNTTWMFDPRIPEDYQVGNDFYRGNKIDKGHLVRRNDPVWGPDSIAKQAENDSFHYTNAAPQHQDLNQREWLGLEDYLLNNANNRDLKINVFTGPVFRDGDLTYRDVQIPEEFWKVVTMKSPSGELHATGYLLSQRQFMDDLEFVFGQFKTYQTSIRSIEQLTGLTFGNLKNHDPLGDSESVDGAVGSMIALESTSSIVL